MVIRNTKRLLVLTLFTLLSACFTDSSVQSQQNSTEPSQTRIKLGILHQSSQCGPSLATQWISSQAQFEKLFKATQRMIVSPSPQQTPIVDFTQNGVLLLSMGQQRTGGYAIRLAREEMQIENESAVISVQWKEPDPGMMVAQVITYPCVFIKVPRGEYQIVRAVDQNNKVRVEFTPD